MLTVRQTVIFTRWLNSLKDANGKARITSRIRRIMFDGHFGDVKFFDGIGELRVDVGPGYRVYFVRRGDVLVILLCGGDKSSQKRDIARAVQLAEEE